jgi:hypothetical protein
MPIGDLSQIQWQQKGGVLGSGLFSQSPARGIFVYRIYGHKFRPILATAG